MTEIHSNLIYDIGLFDGGDTAYYLFRGYNVVAVDANPVMAEKARLRFAKEIEAGQLAILNVGISKTPGTATFWVSDHPERSSFDKNIASRHGAPYKAISVSTVPFSQILAENGVPHYLKIDIEGNDNLCVDALKGTVLPKYISVESECAGESSILPEEEAVAMLNLLRDVGYRRFKLVKQGEWTPVRSSIASHFCMRLVTSAARGRLRVGGLSRIAHRFTDLASIEALGFDFCPGSSGPWGEDIPANWMTFEKARSTLLRERRSFYSRKGAHTAFWYDWHATY